MEADQHNTHYSNTTATQRQTPFSASLLNTKRCAIIYTYNAVSRLSPNQPQTLTQICRQTYECTDIWMDIHTCTHACVLAHKHNITYCSHKRQKVNKSPTTFQIQLPQLHWKHLLPVLTCGTLRLCYHSGGDSSSSEQRPSCGRGSRELCAGSSGCLPSRTGPVNSSHHQHQTTGHSVKQLVLATENLTCSYSDYWQP